jgi:hypothetical protein
MDRTVERGQAEGTPAPRSCSRTQFVVVVDASIVKVAPPPVQQFGSAAAGGYAGDAVIAAAILDRLLHRAMVIDIKGPSWRLKEHQALTEAHR